MVRLLGWNLNSGAAEVKSELERGSVISKREVGEVKFGICSTEQLSGVPTRVKSLSLADGIDSVTSGWRSFAFSKALWHEDGWISVRICGGDGRFKGVIDAVVVT